MTIYSLRKARVVLPALVFLFAGFAQGEAPPANDRRTAESDIYPSVKTGDPVLYQLWKDTGAALQSATGHTDMPTEIRQIYRDYSFEQKPVEQIEVVATSIHSALLTKDWERLVVAFQVAKAGFQDDRVLDSTRKFVEVLQSLERVNEDDVTLRTAATRGMDVLGLFGTKSDWEMLERAVSKEFWGLPPDAGRVSHEIREGKNSLRIFALLALFKVPDKPRDKILRRLARQYPKPNYDPTKVMSMDEYIGYRIHDALQHGTTVL